MRYKQTTVRQTNRQADDISYSRLDLAVAPKRIAPNKIKWIRFRSAYEKADKHKVGRHIDSPPPQRH